MYPNNDGDGNDGPASVEVKIGLLGFGRGRQEVGGRGSRREESGFQVAEAEADFVPEADDGW